MSHKLSGAAERKLGVILSYVQIALNVIIGLLYTPIMLRILGKNEYGLYGTVSSAISMLSLLNLGFSSSYIKFYSGYKSKNEQNKINSFNALFFYVFLVIAVLSLAIGAFFSFHLDLIFDQGLTDSEYTKARIMMLLLTVSTALGFLVTVFNCYIFAKERFVFSKLMGLISAVLTLILDLLVLYSGYGAVGLVALSLILTIVFQLINIIYCVKELHFRFDFRHIEKGLFKQVLTFSGLIAINMIVDKVNQGIDSVLLGRFCGTAVVAVYSVGASLNNYFVNFSTAISGVFTPHVHKLVNDYKMDSEEQREALTAFFVKVGRLQYLLLALIASGVVFFGQPFIRFWAGEGYEDAYVIALILILPGIVPLIQNVGIEIQRAENRHHYRSYIYGAMAVINLVLSVFLCQIWGGIGSAAGTGFAVIVANGIIMNIVYHKKINIDMIVFWKNMIRQSLGMLPAFFCGILIMRFANMDTILKMLLYIVLYTFVYGVCIYLFSMDTYEKNMIKSLVNRCLKRNSR